MTKGNKILIIRLIIALVFWITAIILDKLVFKDLANFNNANYVLGYEITLIILYGISYIIAGYDVIVGAVKHILEKEFLDEYFLMGIATIGAWCLRIFGDYEYIEAVAVMIFFQVGEVFQGIAVAKSKDAIMATMDLSVKTATLENGDVIAPEDVKIGDVIIVKPGEMVPLDGEMITSGVINTASLTGEAVDQDMAIGDMVLSGSINTLTPIKVRVLKEYYDSTATKILDMVENATMKKAKSERFISKFAKIYTPIVVIFALIMALIAPTILGLFNGFSANLYQSFVKEALICLVVSCPCALVVSVPLTYFAGIGAAAKKKIIVKGGTYLEDLAISDTIILDKTGTLTKAKFEVTKIIAEDKNLVIKIAKGLEKNSTHPLAKAINEYEGEALDFEIEEAPGFGVVGKNNNDLYICGSKKLLNKYNINPIEIDEAGSVLYIAKNDTCIGAIILEDIIKEEAIDAVLKLKALGKRIVVLSGDTKASVESVCNRLGISEYHYGLLPADKVGLAEKIIKESKGKVLFVGDGINDAPVLALANVGVSMGQIGSDAAIEASDVVILNDNLKALPVMMKIANRTRRIVIENIIFSLGVKIAILALCAIAAIPMIQFELPMWVAILGDVGVLIVAILNAMRALKYKE